MTSVVASNRNVMLRVYAVVLLFLMASTFGAPADSLTNIAGIHSLSGVHPTRIAVDGKGNLWLVGLNGTELIRVTNTGSLRRFPLKEAHTQVQDIIKGRGGHIWFVATQTRDGSNNVVGEIFESGAEKTYPISRPRAFLTSLTFSSDGRIWFTEFGTGRVGSLAGDGKIREVILPENHAAPQSILATADGSVWTTGTRFIFRIGPNGTISRYRSILKVPLKDIAASGGASFWVTAYDTSALLRVSREGHMAAFEKPSRRFGVRAIVPGLSGTANGYDIDRKALAEITDKGDIIDWYYLGSQLTVDDMITLADGRVCFVSSEGDAYGCVARTGYKPES